MGFTGLALGAMLNRDGIARGAESAAWSPPAGLPHFAPKAKSVIWYFMLGGTSHMESFDPKPALNKFAGKSIDTSPFKSAILDSPFYRKNVRDFAGVPRKLMGTLYPLQVGYRKRGESGIEVSDWWPHVGDCIDDISVIRSTWTTDNDHAAQLQFHTGRHIFDGFYPSIGSWVNYGLGSLSDNLPQFVVMGTPPGDCCGGVGAHDGSYLGPEHSGVRMSVNPSNPLPFGTPGNTVSIEERRSQLDLLAELNTIAGVEYPDDAAMRARIKSYELAFNMQMAVPEVVKLSDETAATQELYGLKNAATRTGLFRFTTMAGTRTANSNRITRHAPRRSINQLAAYSKTSNNAVCSMKRWWCGGPNSAARPVQNAPTAAIITPTVFRSGWRAAASKGAWPTARPTKSASTPSKTATTSPTCTQPSCTNSASTPTIWKSPVKNGWRLILVSRLSR